MVIGTYSGYIYFLYFFSWPEGAGSGPLPARLTPLEAYRVAGGPLPRRKYGHLVRPHQPVAKEKCRLCRLGYTCPVHMDTDEIERRRAQGREVRGSKEARRISKGGKRKKTWR